MVSDTPRPPPAVGRVKVKLFEVWRRKKKLRPPLFHTEYVYLASTP